MRFCVIFIPGLRKRDGHFFSVLQSRVIRWILKNLWHVHSGEVYLFDWFAPSSHFEEEVEPLVREVDVLTARGQTVVLVGSSAGASVAINVFEKRPEKVHRVINICGRLREGQYVSGKKTLRFAAKDHPIFRESVLRCQEAIDTLNSKDPKKVLTVTPLWDQVVPADTVSVEGAKNIRVWCVEHVLSMFVAMVFLRGTIMGFLVALNYKTLPRAFLRGNRKQLT